MRWVVCIWLALSLVTWSGCPRSQGPVGDPASGGSGVAGPDTPRDLGALAIPAESPEAVASLLAELAKAADAGDAKAAWARARYLLDLFDDARFARNGASLAGLHRALALAGKPARGREATDAALAALQREVERARSLAPASDGVRDAAALLAFDARPPTRREEVLGHMRGLSGIIRQDSPVADNARLRLVGYCFRALVDAAGAGYREHIERVSHCLYPLYQSDPAPYFAPLAENRPPPPDWRQLASELDSLIARIAAGQSRLARAGAFQRSAFAKFLASGGKAIPEPIDPVGLPELKGAKPYDWTPLLAPEMVATAPGSAADPAALDALAKAVAGDGRRAVAVASRESAPATEVIAAAQLGIAAGARRIELLGWRAQALKAPPGDYWHSRLRDGKAKRLAVVSLSLAPLAGSSKARSSSWDPARAGLGLHLIVAPTVWRLVAATGSLAEIPAESLDAAERALAARLRDVRAAFGDEDAVVVVPAAGASAGGLARAAAACSRDELGGALMGHIGLADTAPRVVERGLARRIARRQGAKVTIAPEAAANRASVVRACYQDRLERSPGAKGTFRLELRSRAGAAGKIVRIVSGPRDRALRKCVTDALGALMKEREMASVEVTLR